MRAPLARELRSQLEKTVIKARDIAEQAAREELTRLCVDAKNPANYLTNEQRNLRKHLRAHGRQLGDYRKPTGEQGIEHLVTEVGYEHWHRMLFARFLAENNLLMYEDGVTSLAIQDCFDLAEEETGDSSNGWQYAANYAAKMLPQIFRIDSPVFSIDLAPNHQKQLEKSLASLADETFQASDSLGWVYQFWQTKRKEQINKSEVKIGADELPAVTQLFTEPYMVSFLLDNSLGAWWVANHPEIACPVELTYLRTLEDGTPAAGQFEGWPKQLKDLKTLDPCCGSGHFLVVAFLMLVPMRMTVEGLSAEEAVDAVLRDNIHGLELDQRCVELAAFTLALEAWRYPGAGGYRLLPEFHLACSGLGINTKKEEWLALAEGDQELEGALDQLHDLFRQAPTLGSLIDPNKFKSDLLTADFSHAAALLNEIFDKNDAVESHEAGIVAQGMAKAASLLAGQYHWVITNVPYLSRGKQNNTLRDYCEKNYPAGKNDLATAFLERCLDYCGTGGTSSIVIPQNWLFLTSYKDLREKLLKNDTWNMVARLGAQAFQTPMYDFNVQLLTLSRGNSLGDSAGLFADSNTRHLIHGVNVSEPRTAAEKAEQLVSAQLETVEQAKQVENPDARVGFYEHVEGTNISLVAECYQGLVTGDIEKFTRKLWEVSINKNTWVSFRRSNNSTRFYGNVSEVLLWEGGKGQLHSYAKDARDQLHDMHESGNRAWGRAGVAINRMGNLRAVPYYGEHFDNNVAVVFPSKDSSLNPALLAFLCSEEFPVAIRELDQALKVTNRTLVKVPFDIERWVNVADNKYPEGLPKPYSNDPSQWVFHGHPAQSDQALQVAVARLLGYQWPAETDTGMELSDEAHYWVEKTKTLSEYVDDDGIVCLAAVRGEKPAFERLESLLHAAFGNTWSTHIRNKLLEDVGCKNKTLDTWLREQFFEQHCRLFQHRPFIWHFWDGLKDGFSALVNYHKLDKKNLERLIYTYLDDWLRTQSLQLADGVDGAAERLAAAENLKQRLEKILNGEAPYDIFVRWKPIEQQAIGWNPDINDGVRLNIRPFMSVADVGQNGAGILRAKPNIKWTKDRGKNIESAPWYKLGLEYDGKEGDRINEHHLSLAEKQAANDC